jgi:hypothetical protein
MYDKTRNEIETTENATDETSPHTDLGRIAFNKREAILLLHSREHFPRGFDPEDLAISLGWSLDEVREALLACAAFGLVEASPGIEAPPRCEKSAGPEVGIDDLLTPAEKEAAIQSQVPNSEGGWLALGEEIAVLRAVTSEGCADPTPADSDAALEWARQARHSAVLLDLVLDGHIAILGPRPGSEDVRFAALDCNGEVVLNNKPEDSGSSLAARRIN